MACQEIIDLHGDKIQEVVTAQRDENREAIFFFYEDGSSSDIFKGEATKISLSPEEEARIMNAGNVIGSVHSHPSRLDPSTIDIMTGIITQQEAMCVAAPAFTTDIESDYILTCLDLSELKVVERRRMLRAMQRSSIGVTELGRQYRKKVNVGRFRVTACRSHPVNPNRNSIDPTLSISEK